MRGDSFRERANRVRPISLEAVFVGRGASKDPRDKARWHTEQGPISVTGHKFMNWCQGEGGGGAIDLVMHLAGLDFRGAVVWLENHFGISPTGERTWGRTAPASVVGGTADRRGRAPEGAFGDAEPRPVRLPLRNDRQLERVKHYLVAERGLAPGWLNPLIDAGKLYADVWGNSVFLLLGKAQQVVGAELRGTGTRSWRGMAPGSQKDRGFFWIGFPSANDANAVVLCESAIDAISCWGLFPDRICISTSGARASPGWLGALLRRSCMIHCGFDADWVGDAMAREMIRHHPSVKRLRPWAHDWNDLLVSRLRPAAHVPGPTTNEPCGNAGDNSPG